MDPNAALAEIRALLLAVFDADAIPDDAMALAELVQALDDWLTRGGFLPDAWTRPGVPAGLTYGAGL